MNIAVFASHGGSDLQAIMDGCKNNQINAKVAVVISNNGSSMALQRAIDEGIPNYHLSAKKSGSEESLATEILDVLSKYNVEMIVSAKYSCGFSNPLVPFIIVAVRYLDYFTTITEDRLWQLPAKPVFRWRNRSGLSMNAARAA